jgi:hypothetical protein
MGSGWAEGSPTLSSGAGKRLQEEQGGGAIMSVREFLDRYTYKREEVATFLDPDQPNWAKFDSQLGYALRSRSVLKEGVDGCRTILTIQKTGERTRVNSADRPCRINTYGNSFTQGAQVSDGETWQEYLAAHLGESLRNFGVGGYGFYQAYRRMLREEASSLAADYIILNIWGIDDHLRSIDAWRWLRFGERWRTVPGYLNMFHANPWVHIRLNLKTGEIEEEENPYPTPESLYKLCDKEQVYEYFKNDVVVKLLVAQRKGTGANLEELEALARKLNVKADFSSPEAIAQTAQSLHVKYALRTSMQTIEKAQSFARNKHKKLMVLLSYDSDSVMRACEGLPRVDQEFVNFLKENNVLFVDILAKHAEDFRSFNLSPKEYVNRYYIGHYKPLGNHFFAFAIKDAVVDWLDPKPIAYREGSETIHL